MKKYFIRVDFLTASCLLRILFDPEEIVSFGRPLKSKFFPEGTHNVPKIKRIDQPACDEEIFPTMSLGAEVSTAIFSEFSSTLHRC